MKFKFLKATVTGLILSVSCLLNVANADLIVEYDYYNANGNSSLPHSFIDTDYTASALGTVGFGLTGFTNHFYTGGWANTINLGRYYNLTLSSTNNFFLDEMNFSLENTGGTGNYFLRSSLDGFASDISTGSFFNGLVTDFSVDLSGLAATNNIEFRWYMTGSSTIGFANHQCNGGLGGAGCGMADVGVDLGIYGAKIPEPSTLAIFALGIMGLASRRVNKKS